MVLEIRINWLWFDLCLNRLVVGTRWRTTHRAVATVFLGCPPQNTLKGMSLSVYLIIPSYFAVKNPKHLKLTKNDGNNICTSFTEVNHHEPFLRASFSTTSSHRHHLNRIPRVPGDQETRHPQLGGFPHRTKDVVKLLITETRTYSRRNGLK